MQRRSPSKPGPEPGFPLGSSRVSPARPAGWRWQPNACLAALLSLGAGHALAQSCPVGTFSATGQQPCTSAPAGTYVNTTGATSATPAPVGYYVSTTGASSPQQASPGFYVANPGSSAPTQAAPGYYVNAAGASTATPATPGHYVPSAGATSQLAAPLGTYVPSGAAVAPTQAPAGYYVNTPAAVAPTAAPAGYYVDHAGASVPTMASPGHYVPTTGATTSILAPAGSYVDTAGATTATLAPPGRYVATPGSTAATNCPNGTNSYGGSVACRIVSAVHDGSAPVAVGPLLDSNFGTGGVFDVGAVASGSDILMTLLNASTDPALGQLTSLSIFSALLGGADAALFSLVDFTPDVLEAGETGTAFGLRAGSGSGAFSFTLNLLTDQFANFGAAGQTFIYTFNGHFLDAGNGVPEPASLALVLGALGTLGVLRHRRRSRTPTARA